MIHKYQRRINVDIQGNDLIITDNGIGMDLKTIHKKFLSLGETTKQDSLENVGGFGVAKAVILGCGTGFVIETQDNIFSSEDLGKSPIRKQAYRQGTRITLKNVQIGENKTIEDDPKGFIYSLLVYITTSNTDIPIYINGDEYESWFKETRKSRRDPSKFGITDYMIPQNTKIKINVFPGDKGEYKYLYVRLKGLTQFRRYLGWNATCDIVLDFQTTLSPTSPYYPFLSSREELTHKCNQIIDVIKDKVTQSPLSITSEDKFKESFYDNKSTSSEQARIVTSSVTNDNTEEIILELNDIISETISDNQIVQNSIVHKTQQFVQDINNLAQEQSVTKKQFVQSLTVDSIKQLDNALEYSWLIWEDKDTPSKRVNKSRVVECIMLWDTLLRIMASNYPRLRGTIFYPGLVYQPKTLGLCVEKMVNGYERAYIMVNPFEIPLKSDLEIALYLMGIASHELAHFACGTYEAHGETFSYTREAIMNVNLSQVELVVKLLKTSKFKKTLKKFIKANEPKSNKRDESGLNFKGVSLLEVTQIAKDYGVDLSEFRKYTDSSILRMRLIMAIKQAHIERSKIER